MPRSQKARKKSHERKLAKRKVKKQASAPALKKSYRTQIEAASHWPLIDCLISSTWNVEGSLVEVLLARRSPTIGEIGFASFLVDMGCLGVKDAYTCVFMSREEYEESLESRLVRREAFTSCTPDFVAKLLRDSIAYAGKLGFKPHRDYYDASLLVGGDPDVCDVEFTFGKEGRPFYVVGPYDNQWQIIDRLNRAVGPGNYGFVSALDTLADLLNTVVLDDEESPDPDGLPVTAATRELRIDTDRLVEAIADLSDDMHYLDLETGQIETVTAETGSHLERIYPEMPWDEFEEDLEAKAARFSAILESLDLPDATAEAVKRAYAIESDEDRYLTLASYWAVEGYQDMTAFVTTVTDRKARDRLQRALQKFDYLSQFESELERAPKERERWPDFCRERIHQRAAEFLRKWGIDIVAVEPHERGA